MSDTEPCTLDREDRDTDPPTLDADIVVEFRTALAHCADLCVQVLQRLDLGERRFARVERRLDRIEQHLGLRAPE